MNSQAGQAKMPRTEVSADSHEKYLRESIDAATRELEEIEMQLHALQTRKVEVGVVLTSAQTALKSMQRTSSVPTPESVVEESDGGQGRGPSITGF